MIWWCGVIPLVGHDCQVPTFSNALSGEFNRKSGNLHKNSPKCGRFWRSCDIPAAFTQIEWLRLVRFRCPSGHNASFDPMQENWDQLAAFFFQIKLSAYANKNLLQGDIVRTQPYSTLQLLTAKGTFIKQHGVFRRWPKTQVITC